MDNVGGRGQREWVWLLPPFTYHCLPEVVLCLRGIAGDLLLPSNGPAKLVAGSM